MVRLQEHYKITKFQHVCKGDREKRIRGCRAARYRPGGGGGGAVGMSEKEDRQAAGVAWGCIGMGCMWGEDPIIDGAS